MMVALAVDELIQKLCRMSDVSVVPHAKPVSMRKGYTLLASQAYGIKKDRRAFSMPIMAAVVLMLPTPGAIHVPPSIEFQRVVMLVGLPANNCSLYVCSDVAQIWTIFPSIASTWSL